MSQMPVEANVVLTADNAQYDRSMSASAAGTDKLSKSVDSLSEKLDKLTKSAGRKMLGLSAADTALIVSTTAAYAAWEKQMTSLNVQASILTKTTTQHRTLFKEYSREVDGLRRTFGATTAEASQLVQTVQKLKDSTAPVEKLAQSFSRLGAVTNESPNVLASSMLQLQKTMGTVQRDTDKYNNQLAVLQSRSNSSAQAILEFSQSIAPVGRMVNMTQTDIMGFSNAFIRAGQDGYQAANVFNRMLSEIAYATQTGSPELAKYANLVGLTTNNFKELSGTDKYLKIFEAINRQGPQAITTLNRMGLDGMRTVRTVTAMAQQGGMAAEIEAARNADPNALKKGSDVALSGIVDQLKKLRAELAQTGEAFGKNFDRPATATLKVITAFTGGIRALTDSPLGKLAALIAGVVAPFAALAGAISLSAKALVAFSAASSVLRGGIATGFLAQRSAQMGGLAASQGLVAATPLAGRPLSWSQQMMHGIGAGAAWGTRAGALPSSGMLSAGAGWAMTGAGGLSRLMGQALYSPGAMRIPGLQYSGGDTDFRRRPTMFTSPTVRGSFSPITGGIGRFAQSVRLGMAETGVRLAGNQFFPTRGGGFESFDDAYKVNQRVDQMSGSRTGGISTRTQLAGQASTEIAAASSTARALKTLNTEAMTASKGLGNLGKGVGNAAMMMTAAAGGAAKFAGSVSKYAYQSLGMNPMMLGGIGLFAGYQAYKASTGDIAYNRTDMSGFSRPYYEAAGISGPASVSSAPTKADQRVMTMREALNVTASDYINAQASDYAYTNDMIKKAKSVAEAETALSAQWGSMMGSPAAVNAAAMDLTARFGRGQSQEILNRLQSGMGQKLDITTLAQEAARPGSEGWMDRIFREQSGSLGQQKVDKLFGAIDDYAAYIEATKGSAERVTQVNDLLDESIRDFSKADSGYETKAVFRQAMTQRLLGVELGKDQYETDSRLGTFTGGTESLESFITSTVTGAGRAGNRNYVPGLDTEQLRTALKNYGLDPALAENPAEAAKAILKAIENQPAVVGQEDADRASAGDVIRRNTQGIFGAGGILGLSSVQTALTTGAGDQNAQFRATNQIAQRVRGGISTTGGQVEFLLNQIAAATGDPTLGAELFQGALGKIQQGASFRAPYQTRTQNFAQQRGIFSGVMAANLGPEGMAVREQATGQFQQQVQAQYDYFKNQLYQQREFNVSRERAEYDFNLSRSYSAHDFNLARSRSEYDFNLQRNRAEDDYTRNLRRNRADFNLSRKREEEDYQHSVMLMVEAQSKAMYNMYERAQVQRTSSADWLAVNNQDQLSRIRGQSRDLGRLRKMGVNDDVIQQLGLTDSANAQQLSRFVAELSADPALVKEFNKAVSERLKAASKLTRDESSTEWQEFRRSYRLNRERAAEDFEKSVRRSRHDFRLSLARQDDDFRTSLNRQQQDYATAMGRQEEAFRLTMQRSAEDLARSARTIDGNFEKILTKATEKLSGHAQRQARAVLREFKDLKSSTSPYAVDIMQTLADIFGVKYTPPKSAGKAGGGHAAANQGGGSNSGFGPQDGGYAQGGVTPGYTPGRDVHHYSSPTGGNLSLSGGEAIMVPEWTRWVGGPKAVAAMNHEARHGYAKGGVVNPDGKVWMDGEPISRITKAQVLLAEKLSRMNFHIMQGSWQPYTPYSGSSHMGPGVIDTSPGSFPAQYWLRRVGFAAWARNIPGAGYAGSGAHVHAISRLDPGARHHAQLSSFARGEDGLGGRDYGPNPPLIPGLMGMLSQFTDLMLAAGSPGAMGALTDLKDILKDRYPKAERAAADMSTVHPLQEGAISKVINRAARTRYKQLSSFGEGAIFTGAANIDVAERGSELVLPLNDAGLEYLTMLLAKISGGTDSKLATGATPVCTHNEYNYQIDRSTTFSGPITVQANNPHELLESLKARQRLAALSQPVLGGAR